MKRKSVVLPGIMCAIGLIGVGIGLGIIMSKRVQGSRR